MYKYIVLYVKTKLWNQFLDLNVSDLHQIKKMKNQVDNFSSEHTRVPEWVLLLEWMQNDKPPEPLQY